MKWQFLPKAADGDTQRETATSIHQIELSALIEHFTSIRRHLGWLGRRQRI